MPGQKQPPSPPPSKVTGTAAKTKASGSLDPSCLLPRPSAPPGGPGRQDSGPREVWRKGLPRPKRCSPGRSGLNPLRPNVRDPFGHVGPPVAGPGAPPCRGRAWDEPPPVIIVSKRVPDAPCPFSSGCLPKARRVADGSLAVASLGGSSRVTGRRRDRVGAEREGGAKDGWPGSRPGGGARGLAGAPPAGSGAKGQAEGSARGAGTAARVTAARPCLPQLGRGGRAGSGRSPLFAFLWQAAEPGLKGVAFIWNAVYFS